MSADPGLSRRSLVKGAAWAAPVVLVAATTPLAAASGIIGSASGNWWPDWGEGAEGWITFTLSADAPTPTTGNVTVIVDGVPATVTNLAPSGITFQVGFTLPAPPDVQNPPFTLTVQGVAAPASGSLTKLGG